MPSLSLHTPLFISCFFCTDHIHEAFPFPSSDHSTSTPIVISKVRRRRRLYLIVTADCSTVHNSIHPKLQTLMCPITSHNDRSSLKKFAGLVSGGSCTRKLVPKLFTKEKWHGIGASNLQKINLLHEIERKCKPAFTRSLILQACSLNMQLWLSRFSV